MKYSKLAEKDLLQGKIIRRHRGNLHNSVEIAATYWWRLFYADFSVPDILTFSISVSTKVGYLICPSMFSSNAGHYIFLGPLVRNMTMTYSCKNSQMQISVC